MPDGPLELHPQVALRPEPFGALAYHFDTRRLVFLKSSDLVDLVHALAEHPSAGHAIDAVAALAGETGDIATTRPSS